MQVAIAVMASGGSGAFKSVVATSPGSVTALREHTPTTKTQESYDPE